MMIGGQQDAISVIRYDENNLLLRNSFALYLMVFVVKRHATVSIRPIDDGAELFGRLYISLPHY